MAYTALLVHTLSGIRISQNEKVLDPQELGNGDVSRVGFDNLYFFLAISVSSPALGVGKVATSTLLCNTFLSTVSLHIDCDSTSLVVVDNDIQQSFMTL
jgi:hypothetical protein